MKRHALAALAAAPVLTLLPAAVLADTVGTYLLGDPQKQHAMTISYKDDQHVRMETGEHGYMLMTGSKFYMVTTEHGQTRAIDMDTLPQFAVPKQDKKFDPSKVKITKTGRSETVAGIKGDVYTIDTEDGHHAEVVLSTDKRVVPLTSAFHALAKHMAEKFDGSASAGIELAYSKGYGALLRSNQNMVLQSVGDKSLPASNYELPAGVTPMQMPSFGGAANGQRGAGGGAPQGMPAMDPEVAKKMMEAMQRMKQQQGN